MTASSRTNRRIHLAKRMQFLFFEARNVCFFFLCKTTNSRLFTQQQQLNLVLYSLLLFEIDCWSKRCVCLSVVFTTIDATCNLQPLLLELVVV